MGTFVLFGTWTEHRGLMDTDDFTDSLPESLALDDDGVARHLAALENEALQVEHADSLQLEEQIAAAMESASTRNSYKTGSSGCCRL